MAEIRGYVSRLETQATPGIPPRHVAFLTPDELGQGKEVQVETPEHRLQTTLELAYATRRLIEVSFKQGDESRTLTSVNILRRDESDRKA